MAAVTALSASVTVNAVRNSDSASPADTSETIGSVDNEGYVLISEEKYMDGDFFIVDRLYEYPGISTYASDTGEKDLKKSRAIYVGSSSTNSGDLLAIMWVSGTFKWNKSKDTATISDAKAWIDHYEGSNHEIKAKSGYPKSASNQGATLLGGALGKKYAYIEYYITIKDKIMQYTNEYRLWLDVDVEGEEHVKT